ncbi:MAG: AraC family transcriptional regulator [Lachnospiraceae bacterium]|nr:AraC family transcriptional regulator [Lachnospiraceae bacterium]
MLMTFAIMTLWNFLIVAIAASCGFHDISYFTKIFKRAVGVTPSMYSDTI